MFILIIIFSILWFGLVLFCITKNIKFIIEEKQQQKQKQNKTIKVKVIKKD